ncbi:MAG: 3-oxoacyl-ACP reductase FabG [Planctomycetota bacterium]
MRTIDLSGKTAVVTGAGQGIGKATAQSLIGAGANVAINFFEDAEGNNRKIAEATASELGENSMVVPADVRDKGQLDTMYQSVVEKFGGLDIVVNNAGILRDRSAKKMSESEWSDVIDTNLTGVFKSCQAAINHLNSNGTLINVASLSAVMGFFGQANYASAKAGVVTLTKVLSKELARSGIRVNAIAPGVVDTEMGKSIPEENRKVMLANVPLGRFAEPQEIGDVILFLASDLSSYMTGQTLHVNGGWWA